MMASFKRYRLHTYLHLSLTINRNLFLHWLDLLSLLTPFMVQEEFHLLSFLTPFFPQTMMEAESKGDGKIDEEEWKEFVIKYPSIMKNMTLPYLKLVLNTSISTAQVKLRIFLLSDFKFCFQGNNTVISDLCAQHWSTRLDNIFWPKKTSNCIKFLLLRYSYFVQKKLNIAFGIYVHGSCIVMCEVI